MKIKWVIFLILNILEIISFLILLYLDFKRLGLFNGSTTEDYLGLFLVMLVIVVVLSNCIINIYRVRIFLSNHMAIKIKSLVSRIIAILFFILIILLAYGLLHSNPEIQGDDQYNRELKIYFALQCFIVVNGLVILYYQGRLRRFLQLKYYKEVNVHLEEIGS